MDDERTTSLRLRKIKENGNPFHLHADPSALGVSFLPSFRRKIRQTLSLKDNPMLSENWEKFINSERRGPVVRLYPDIVADCNKNRTVKRMQLNGQFYNKHGKLTPVPVDTLAAKDESKIDSSKSSILPSK